ADHGRLVVELQLGDDALRLPAEVDQHVPLTDVHDPAAANPLPGGVDGGGVVLFGLRRGGGGVLRLDLFDRQAAERFADLLIEVGVDFGAELFLQGVDGGV